jgi:acyl-coenzyme A synthetase/AMP-(fatty) acid ligase
LCAQIKVGKRKGDVRIVLFVKLADGVSLDAELEAEIRGAIRNGASDAHVPALIRQVHAIPTRNFHSRSPLARPQPQPQPWTLTQTLSAHVPTLCTRQVYAIPYTRSGKKVELAVRALFEGDEPKNVGALQDPNAFDEYRKMAEEGL